MPSHGSHNGLCSACLDNGVLHIVVARDSSQGTEHLFHEVLCGLQGEVTLACVPAANLLLAGCEDKETFLWLLLFGHMWSFQGYRTACDNRIMRLEKDRLALVG